MLHHIVHPPDITPDDLAHHILGHAREPEVHNKNLFEEFHLLLGDGYLSWHSFRSLSIFSDAFWLSPSPFSHSATPVLSPLRRPRSYPARLRSQRTYRR